MGWGARTQEGRFHTRRSTPVRLLGKLHNLFRPGGRGTIAGCTYTIDRTGAIRRARRALTITKERAAA
jgi:hypothetical protein